MYSAYIEVRKALSSVVGSVHGFAVGGGIALMPSAQFDTTVSFTISSFGNISRGNVLDMFLSSALLQLEGSICAAGLYALDSATDSAVVLRSAMLHASFREVIDEKAASTQMMAAAYPPQPAAVTARDSCRDAHRYKGESLGISPAHLHG